MTRSSLTRVVFFGSKPYHSQITQRLLCQSIPPNRSAPRWLNPIGIQSYPYSTKPDPEAATSQTNAVSSTASDVNSSLSDTISSSSFSSSLNPPASARPQPFNSPVRKPNQNTASYYWALGKASLSFYKTGIKAIYNNFKLMRTIQARLSGDDSRLSRAQLLEQGLISRGEYHLMQRTAADIARAPLFVLIFLVFGEWTPLVVVAFSRAVPRTLWIPKQVRKAREQQQERHDKAKAAWQEITPGEGGSVELQPAARDTVLGIGRMLGVYPQWWDRLPWTPTGAVMKRVQRRLDEVEVDDKAIERDGGVEALEEEEVSMAAEARGLPVIYRDVDEIRDDLKRWLHARNHHSSIELIANGLPPLQKR